MPEQQFQTRAQRFAATIFEQVSEIESKSKSEKTQYASMAHKLPVLIRTAGLAQALAFVEARHKANSPPRTLLEHLGTVLSDGNLSQTSRTTRNLGEYMRLTQNVLAALHWYKRFAQSVLGVDASEANQNDDLDDKDSEANQNIETAPTVKTESI